MAASKPTGLLSSSLVQASPIILAFAILAIPTMMTLGDQTWSTETGAQGPLVLCTGAWLLWRLTPEFRREAEPGHPAVTAVILAMASLSYIFGRAYDFITLETAGVYGAGLAMLHAHLGARVMLKNWFPFLY